MSELGDQLRRQAEAADAEGELADRMDAALVSYRADMSEANRLAYREAVEALAASRATARAGRVALVVTAEKNEV